MDSTPLPAYALCERCWGRITPAQRFVRYGHLNGVKLTGDPVWAYTYVHLTACDGACDLTTVAPSDA